MKLNQENIPPALHLLIPFAEKWGIGDDFEREQLVLKSTEAALSELVNCLDIIDEDELWDWLSGDDSFSDSPTAEYLAYTNLTMAIDYARLRVKI